MNGWVTSTLGDLGEPIIGLTYSPSQISMDGTLVLRSSNIQNGQLALDDVVRVSAPIPERIRIRKGDILICVRNGSRPLIGKSLYLDERVAGETFGAFMSVFRSSLNPYLRFFFQSNSFKRQVDEHLGATINQITNASLRSFVASYPENGSERQTIAAALGDVEDHITALDRLIAKKRDIRQGMMQELLTGRTRLPGFASTWAIRKLGDLLSYRQPGQYLVASTEYVDAGVPVLTAGKSFVLGHTTERHGIFNELPVIIFDDFTTDSKFVTFPFKAKSSAMKMLSAKTSVDLRWVYERMQLIDFVAVDHKRRWISEYSRIEVATPDLEEQRALAAIAAEAQAEIDALKARLRSARAIRQGMMQELLTGRTRLPVQEVAV